MNANQKVDPEVVLQNWRTRILNGFLIVATVIAIVMTVATIVASLLPIMWSARTGAEVMKPLATPVIGGMVSSLIHILIVTPVIFAWLRERELRKELAGKTQNAGA